MADVFLSDLPVLSQKRLHWELNLPCASIGAHAYLVTLKSGARGGWAILTLPSQNLANVFVQTYGKFSRDSRPLLALRIMGKEVFCKHSNKPTRDLWVVKSLVEQQNINERTTHVNAAPGTSKPQRREKLASSFQIAGFECGAWTPDDYLTVFNPRYSCKTPGTVKFRPQSIVIEIERSHSQRHTLLMYYHDVVHIVTDARTDVFFSLYSAPRIYLNKRVTKPESAYVEWLTKDRIGGIDELHEAFAGFSLVYKVSLCNTEDHGRVLRLGKKGGIPPIKPKAIASLPAKMEFTTAFFKLVGELQMAEIYPYRCAFQLNKLVSNAIMPPECVLQLLPRVRQLISEVGPRVAAEILAQLVAQDFGHVGIDSDLSGNMLMHAFEKRIQISRNILTPEYFVEQEKKHANMAYVHRVMITPTGVFSYGPKWEASNRVLREYSEYQDYFLRVIFCEEDGEQFMHEPRVNSDRILKYQFLARIDPDQGGAIVIAGRQFEFLGFSNSSLKTQTCWYMAPFYCNAGRMTAERLIKSLGDFSNIRTPGRFAARVGQAFSDTIGSALVEPAHEVEIPDVERPDAEGKNRIFSDGVGKVSWDMVKRIWKSSERIDEAKPTVFQIRYAGAKGMIALDPSLGGDKLCLRPSMIKFLGSESRKIEICSWAKRLPMYLNRPLIKVLEDRKISDATFMGLQNQAVERLRDAARSPYHAADHLRRRGVSSQSLKLPWLFDTLCNLGLDFWDDPFLERTLELALLIDLRDMKYRGRIPVPQGLTLVGVLDETKCLREGEIFISTEQDNEPEEILGDVLITRSPVHHPGDVQRVRSVSVPDYSPLRELRNCVVFSQLGKRPLPSMLGGGDLDGDLYNIIYDRNFILSHNEEPAEYPSVKPLNLDRPVVASDVAKFFIDFIENNLLGLISHRHLLIADQEQLGVYHPNCLKLAEMASTTVDFPKTGHKVDRKDLPPASRAKPDFMAPGPRVLISKEKGLQEPAHEIDDDEDTLVQTWYPSDKILGKLYRAIKENEFLADVRNDLRPSRPKDLLLILWNYFLQELKKMKLSPPWVEYLTFATDTRAQYDEQLRWLMQGYSDTPWKSILSEEEVFVGTIVGKEKQTRRQRELSSEMKEEFDMLVQYTIARIRGETETRDVKLAKCLAALNVCVAGGKHADQLRSFAWVVVSVLMTEVDALQKEQRKGKGNPVTMRVGARRGGQ
ncbi:RNA dependent RNA polymerase-domain-containing protein [Sphaerosporella brunnea]|uniref:RNA-dependent RNA polymerase n=1 Tax=Sphaerosporella brunnea TaxID=1250544 RepID=A0A5J5F7I6_9PEZI|nr:RNA dependent RNA polymerase-domain-containing protein [Sphaerosporella brunnea]